MKYLILLLILIGFVMPQAFGTEEIINGYSGFELLPSEIITDTPISFEIKFMYYNQPYSIESFSPVIEVNPSSARQNVHIEIEPINVYPGQIFRIPVMMTVDSKIEHEKIFLNLSFIGNNTNSDIVYKSGWTNSAILGILQNDTVSKSPVSEFQSESIASNILQNQSPLKQLKSGIKFHNIECNEGLVLAQRGNSERSACVTLDTKIELIIRGWADDDRVILGCVGEHVQECYPEDKEEYRKKLQNYYYGFNEEPDSKIDVSCMPMEASKSTAIFFKIPSYLPEGYSFKCSFSGTPYESYLIFDNKKVPDRWISHYPELVSNGAVFIYQTDQKSAVGEKEFQTYGSAEQRIQETYDSVMQENPSLNPQLITINGMLAYAVDSCSNCGMHTANFTDGTNISESTSTETRIKFIDENGVKYMLETTLPLDELIKVAESLQ